MTDRIAEIRERASKATEGPWCVSDIAGDFILVLGNDGPGEQMRRDAAGEIQG